MHEQLRLSCLFNCSPCQQSPVLIRVLSALCGGTLTRFVTLSMYVATSIYRTIFVKKKLVNFYQRLSNSSSSPVTTTLHGVWSSAEDHSRLFYIWQFGSSFSISGSLNHLSLHFSLILGRPSVLTPIDFQSVMTLTRFISSILLWSLRIFVPCSVTYLTMSIPCISYCSLLLFLILHSFSFLMLGSGSWYPRMYRSMQAYSTTRNLRSSNLHHQVSCT
jgi:hypothetical protein